MREDGLESRMSNLPDRSTFESAYAGKAPWDIGKPQGAIAESADLVTSPVLDAGCGTGENALFLAARGHHVIGIDFIDGAWLDRGIRGERRNETRRLGRAIHHCDRQRSVPRFLRRGPGSLRRRAYPRHCAWRTALAVMLQ